MKNPPSQFTFSPAVNGIPPEYETPVLEAVRRSGPLHAYRQLIAENDALILSPDLKSGQAITMARTAIHTTLVAGWAAARVKELEYEMPFAVVALGGTGRGEVTPCSDLDFAFLFEDSIEGNGFLLELQRQTIQSDEFLEQNGFSFSALPFCPDDIPNLEERQLNSFLDMIPVFDPSGLADRFRRRIRDSYDPFEHFLHVRGFWQKQWDQGGEASERLDHFDIKNDGLRLFLGAIWTLAEKGFRHSHEIYQELEDPRDLEAYYFMLRIRAWIHLQKNPGRQACTGSNHSTDVLTFRDFVSFGNMPGPEVDARDRFEFDNDVRARLLSARRRVACFSRGIIERELLAGRPVTPRGEIVFGASGLYHKSLPVSSTSRDRSRAALRLLLASQHYGVPVAPSELQGTFQGAGDWLEQVPEVSALFQEERGSLASSFEFLSRLDGAMDQLFPGYGRFESTLDERVMREGHVMRGVLEREKMRALEGFVSTGAEQMKSSVSASSLAYDDEASRVALVASVLDSDHLVAVKLALKTKRLPVTPGDEAARNDVNREWFERFASGLSNIPLADYYTGWDETCGFSQTTLDVTRFLIANRRTLKNFSRIGHNSDAEAEELARICGDEQRLRALFVFTCADRVHWESENIDPGRWFSTRELYTKTLVLYRPQRAGDAEKALIDAGFGEQETAVLKDFGPDFFSGLYRRHAARFGSHLLRIVDKRSTVGPKVAFVRDGSSLMLAVATRDWRGLAACISGALWKEGVEVSQAHLFSAVHQGLALDFFHLPTDRESPSPDLPGIVEHAILNQLHIAPGDEATLPEIHGKFTLSDIRPGEYCLRLECGHHTRGATYALCYRVFHQLRGDIHGLVSFKNHRSSFVSIYLNLPKDLSHDEAQQIVEGWR